MADGQLGSHAVGKAGLPPAGKDRCRQGHHLPIIQHFLEWSHYLALVCAWIKGVIPVGRSWGSHCLFHKSAHETHWSLL